MKPDWRLFLLGLLIIGLLLDIYPNFATAQTASPREQFNQYIAELQRNPNDQLLREKIIRLAGELKPQPAVPPEVDELVGRATYIFKNAKSEADFKEAAQAYEKVVLMAPWLPDYYYNLGIAQEKAGKPTEAIISFQFYLMAAPEARDTKEIRQRIGGLKYAAEQTAAREATPRAAVENPDTQIVKRLDGAKYVLAERYDDGTRSTSTYQVRGTQVIFIFEFFDPPGPPRHSQQSFGIQGRQFWAPVSDGCRSSYQTNNCGYLGTISENGITFEFQADGRNVPRILMGPPDYVPRAR